MKDTKNKQSLTTTTITVNINTKSDLICEDLIQSNLKLIHSHIVSNHLSQRPPNKVLQDQTPSVSPAELLLSRETRRTLAQLRTNKSPLLVSYLFSIGDPRHPSPLCPLCLMHDHTSSHLFECKSLPTSLSSLDLWTNPDKVEPFLATWGERLLAATWFGCWTLLAASWWSGVDNNNNNELHMRFNIKDSSFELAKNIKDDANFVNVATDQAKDSLADKRPVATRWLQQTRRKIVLQTNGPLLPDGCNKPGER